MQNGVIFHRLFGLDSFFGFVVETVTSCDIISAFLNDCKALWSFVGGFLRSLRSARCLRVKQSQSVWNPLIHPVWNVCRLGTGSDAILWLSPRTLGRSCRSIWLELLPKVFLLSLLMLRDDNESLVTSSSVCKSALVQKSLRGFLGILDFGTGMKGNDPTNRWRLCAVQEPFLP